MRMDLTRRMISALACAAVLVVLGACGGGPKRADYSGYFWPSPPDKKRIQLLNIIYSDMDIRELSAFDYLVGEGGSTGFLKPHGIAYDDVTDMLFVADSYGKGVLGIDFKNKIIMEITAPYGLLKPFGLAVDSRNRVLAIAHTDQVMLISLDGFVPMLKLGTKGEFRNAIGVALDPERKFLYVSDSKLHNVQKFSYSGEKLATIAEKGADDGQVAFPAGMTVDSDGNLYVVDTGHWRVLVFGPDGKYVRQFGSHGSSVGQFGRPKDVAVSKDGIIFVTEADFHFVVMFNRNGDVLMAFGGPGSQPDKFVTPSGITVGSNNLVYVVDQNNRRVKIYQLLTDEEYERMSKQPASGQKPADAEQAPASEQEPPSEQEPASAEPEAQ